MRRRNSTHFRLLQMPHIAPIKSRKLSAVSRIFTRHPELVSRSPTRSPAVIPDLFRDPRIIEKGKKGKRRI